MPLLVEPEWVAEQMKMGSVTVVDATLPPVGVVPRVDTHARYLERHLPGAVFFDIDALSEKDTTLPHMLPTAQAFGEAMGQLGIGSEDTIIVYEQEGVFSAPRAWWMLRTLGAREVCVMQGGLKAWTDAGLPVESGEVHRATASFLATLRQDAVKDLPQLRAMLAEGAQVLDARSAGRFSGSAPEPRPGFSSGHMPGATGLPYTDLVEGGRLKDVAALRDAFAAKGVALDKPVTTTCGSGVTAAVLTLGLEVCGAEQVSLYDGSWAEYAAQPDAVIQKD